VWQLLEAQGFFGSPLASPLGSPVGSLRDGLLVDASGADA
jgi:hypothetical protein